MTLDRRNWLLAGAAIALLFILAALLAALAGERRSDVMLRRPSTFFTDPSGARALLLVMKKLLPGADPWRQPLHQLPRPRAAGAPTTLIVAGPLLSLSKVEAEHLDRWLSDGGQLILASADGWPLRERKASRQVAAQDADSKATSKSPGEPIKAAKNPSYLATHAPALRWSELNNSPFLKVSGPSIPHGPLNLKLQRRFSATGDFTVIAAASDHSALALELPVGQGRIVAIADPMAISNSALRSADNAVWLVTLAAAWGNGMVLFDEYHHGFGEKRSVARLAWAFSKTPWGWCLWQIGTAALLYFFVYRRRFGRISEPAVPSHSSPLEQVDARAGIFHAAGAQRLAVDLIMQNLSQELGHSHGRAIDVATLKPIAAKKFLIPESSDRLVELQTLALKAARGDRLSEAEFIKVGGLAGSLIKGQKPHLTELKK